MNLLKGKTVIILYSTKNIAMYENACMLYKDLIKEGVISLFIVDEELLQVIENSSYDLRYVFLYDGYDVPPPEQEKSVYQLFDITNPHHYWIDVNSSYKHIIDFFNKVELELSHK